MAKEIYLSGTCKYLKYLEVDKYEHYTVNLYMDDKSWDKFNESGSQLKIREDEDGKFVTFKRKAYRDTDEGRIDMGRPVYYDSDGNVVEDESLVGNGSKITIMVRVYPTSMGVGTDWIKFRVDELVEYGKVTVDEDIDVPF